MIKKEDPLRIKANKKPRDSGGFFIVYLWSGRCIQ